MLGADMVISAGNAALQDREVSLNRVRVYVAAHVFANAVVNGLMAGKHRADTSASIVAHYIDSGVKRDKKPHRTTLLLPCVISRAAR